MCDTDIVYALLLVTSVYVVPELTATEVEVTGDAADSTIAFASWTRLADMPGNQAFVENYWATYGIELEPWAAHSYMARYILVETVMAAGSTDAMAVRDELANIKNLDTILGQFSFNADRDAVCAPMVLLVENGASTVFE